MLAVNLVRLLNSLSRLHDAASEVAREIEAARAESDPFARHVFQARRDYARAALNDTKTGKRSREEAWRTYKGAMELGFRGDGSAWLVILTTHVPPK